MSGSSQKYKLFAVLLIGLSQTAWADEATWPQLDKASDSSICSEAFKIANSAYRSDNSYLYAPPAIPQDIGITLVLQPSAHDTSVRDTLVTDPSVFQKIPKNNQDGNYPTNIYWQIKAKNGLRYVMNEDAFGWRGDQYTLFTLKEDITPDKFIECYTRNPQEAAFTPLIGEGWILPLMLQEKNTENVWAIDVGAPYTFLSNWVVYSIGTDGAKQRCMINFHPAAKTATALLPMPVRKLAALLDGTLGSGENEGTYQATARLKTEVMHRWANVAMRPWAASKAQPYDRGELEASPLQCVDTDLKERSRLAEIFKLYPDISTQYPKAERALADYYKSQFNKNIADADAMAKQTLYIAFCTYFYDD